jgi:hypothetical protein
MSNILLTQNIKFEYTDEDRKAIAFKYGLNNLPSPQEMELYIRNWMHEILADLLKDYYKAKEMSEILKSLLE